MIYFCNLGWWLHSPTSFRSVYLRVLSGEEDGDRKATPIAKLPKHFGDFYVTPQTHLMYSATW